MPQIRVKNGPQKGKVIPIKAEPLVLGREPSCGLQISDKGVSREHAEIYRVGEMVFIRDRGSRNGSFVNEEKIEEELLREGDVIRVGGTQLIFEGGRISRAEGRDIKYDDEQPFRTSLELKLDDLYVMENTSAARDGELFKAICQATQIVQAERDEKKLFQRLLDLMQEYIPADHLYIFVRDENTGAISPRAMKTKSEDASIPISKSILRKVISECSAILTADAMQDDRFKADDSIVMNKIRSVLCVPVQTGGQAIGAIYAVNIQVAETFDQSDLQLITAMGAHLALAMENLNSIRGRRRMFLRTIGRLTSLLEGLPPGQRGHAERVSIFAAAIATEMDVTDQDLLYVSLAGLMHDIGKLPAVSAAANPPDPTAREAHIIAGVEFIKSIFGLEQAVAAVKHHHERFDGTGVPGKLKGAEIPLSARIVAVANDFDKLVFPPAKAADADGDSEPDPTLVRSAFKELDSQAGKLYDPQVVRALMVAYRHGALRRVGRDGSVILPANPYNRPTAEIPFPKPASPLTETQPVK